MTTKRTGWLSFAIAASSMSCKCCALVKLIGAAGEKTTMPGSFRPLGSSLAGHHVVEPGMRTSSVAGGHIISCTPWASESMIASSIPVWIGSTMTNSAPVTSKRELTAAVLRDPYHVGQAKDVHRDEQQHARQGRLRHVGEQRRSEQDDRDDGRDRDERRELRRSAGGLDDRGTRRAAVDRKGAEEPRQHAARADREEVAAAVFVSPAWAGNERPTAAVCIMQTAATTSVSGNIGARSPSAGTSGRRNDGSVACSAPSMCTPFRSNEKTYAAPAGRRARSARPGCGC